MGGGASKKQTEDEEEAVDTPFTLKYEMDMTDSGKLGEGSYAVVRKGNVKGETDQWAIKCVDKSNLTELDLAALADEVEILNSINHPNIMSLKESFDEKRYFYLVTELVVGGELFDRIVEKEAYNEFDAASLTKIFLQTLEHLHNNCVVHRDLKPENLLLKSSENDHEIKLADFGYAVKIDSPTFDDLVDQCGTPGYVAPEIITHLPYGSKCDMWSAGVIIFILLGGYPPFANSDQNGLYEMIKTANYEFEEEYWGHISAEAKDLISKLLTVDASLRLSATEALQHDWIKGMDGHKEEYAGHDMTVNKEHLKTFNAKRKMKATVKTIMLTNKMMSAFGSPAGGMLAKIKAAQAKLDAAKAQADEIESKLPDLVDHDTAQTMTGDRFTEERFAELANEAGVIEKAKLMKIIRQEMGIDEEEAAKLAAEDSATPAPDATAEAAAAADAAAPAAEEPAKVAEEGVAKAVGDEAA